MISERQAYIEESRSIAHEMFDQNQMLVCYVRHKRSKRGLTGCTLEQSTAIRSFLNLAGGDVKPIPALRIINDSILPEQQFPLEDPKQRQISVDAYTSVRKNWLSRKSPIVGVVVAIKTGKGDTEAKIGWSLCHENDKWNKYIGIRKALNFVENVRVVEQQIAKEKSRLEMEIPHTLIRPIEEMMARAVRIYNK